MAAKKRSPQTQAEATGSKGIRKDNKKRKRIRKYELVTRWRKPVFERGAI